MVAICAEHAKGAKVTRVTLEVGKLAAVLPDSLHFCFDTCTKDTAVEGAELEIIEKAGRAQCRDCGDVLALSLVFGRCVCGSAYLRLVAGYCPYSRLK